MIYAQFQAGSRFEGLGFVVYIEKCRPNQDIWFQLFRTVYNLLVKQSLTWSSVELIKLDGYH